MREWAAFTGLPCKRFLPWIGLYEGRYHDWKQRYGRANEHNGWIPRDHWLDDDEKEAIKDFARNHPLEGYRRLTFVMMDQDIAAASPSTVYRVLKEADLLQRWKRGASAKGTGYQQPEEPHQDWHTDIAYLNICGTFYYLISVLDGCSRSIIAWDIGESMTTQDVEIVLQRAHEAFPDARPKVVSDNGGQFVSRDFKELIRVLGMTHARTSPYYPQSNGKIERWHHTIKSEGIRPATPLSLDDARRIAADFIDHYNNVRLHSAIGYVTPKDRREGRHLDIFQERDHKLQRAREARAQKRQQARAQLDQHADRQVGRP